MKYLVLFTRKFDQLIILLIKKNINSMLLHLKLFLEYAHENINRFSGEKTKKCVGKIWGKLDYKRVGV